MDTAYHLARCVVAQDIDPLDLRCRMSIPVPRSDQHHSMSLTNGLYMGVLVYQPVKLRNRWTKAFVGALYADSAATAGRTKNLDTEPCAAGPCQRAVLSS